MVKLFMHQMDFFKTKFRCIPVIKTAFSSMIFLYQWHHAEWSTTMITGTVF